jgi:RNA recognition motif-containing protein
MIQWVFRFLVSILVLFQSSSLKSMKSVKHKYGIFAIVKPHTAEQKHADKVFIGNLPFSVTEAIIRDIVQSEIGEGKISEIKIAAGKKTKRPLGFLFIDFVDLESAIAAVSLFDGYNLEGRVLNSNLKIPDDVSLIKASPLNIEKMKSLPLSPYKASKTIYLSNLDYSLDEEEISNMCDDLVGFGLVSDVRIPADKETGSSRGFAYIEFKLAATVEIAIKELSDVEVYGRLLKVERMSMPKKKEAVAIVKEEDVDEDIYAALTY